MKLRTLGAAALLASFALPVMASTQASLSLSGFTTTLKDLNPNDGVTPSIQWLMGDLATESTDATQQGWNQFGWWSASPIWSTEPNLYNLQLGAWTMDQVSLHGHGTQHLALSDQGAAGSLLVTAHAEAGQNVSSSAYFYLPIWLSAGTKATFSMTVDGDWSATPPGATPPPGWLGPLNSSGVSASMGVGSPVAETKGSATAYWPYSADAYESSIDGSVLTLTVKNTSADSKLYSLFVTGNAYAMETALPVPEPETYAMLGAGLLMIGALARRRKA